MTKTIVHVGSYRPDSANGVHQALAGQVKHLAAMGQDVEVWHFQRHVSEPTVDESKGLRIVRLPQTSPVARAGPLAGLIRLPTRGSRRWVRERAAAVRLMHLHSVFQPENMWLSRLGIPYVLTPHGGYSPSVLGGRNRAGKWIAMKTLEATVVNGARFLQAVSDGEAGDLRRLTRHVPVEVIPNGVALPPENQSTSQVRTWLYMGRLAVDHKGLDLLVRGYALAFAHNPHLPDLVIAGPDFRGGREHLQTLVGDLGMNERVRFPGALDAAQKTEYLRRASLFIHTSRWDGLPISALEALAAGVPLLVTPGTNLAEVVKGAMVGYVVEPVPQAIAAGLLLAATATDHELQRQRRDARAVAQRRYSWPAVAQNLMSAYAKFC